jgi:cell division septation protein DedD
MIEYGPQDVAQGRTTEDMDPGIAQTVQQVTEGLTATSAANAESQAQAHAFISENGAQVVGGHTPVNSPTGAFMTPMSIPAPEFASDTPAPLEFDAGVG